MRSRLPLKFTVWLISVTSVAILAIAGFQMREMALREASANKRVAQAQVAINKLRQEHNEMRDQLTRIQQDARSLAAQAKALQERKPEPLPMQMPMQVVAKAIEPVSVDLQRSPQQEKEEAWGRFFRPLKGCDVWRDDRHMVECQNYVIRAKREFEKRWGQGTLGAPGA